MRLTSVVLTVVMISVSIIECRGVDKSGVDQSDLKAEKPWYDANGEIQRCEKQPLNCNVTRDPKPFIDTCVGQGYQAKSCGCLVLCTGAIKGFKLADEASRKTELQSANACAAIDQTVIKSVKQMRKPGSSLDRCLTSHVCNGRIGLCSGADLATSTRLREGARRGCADLVLDSICNNGFQDTFYCEEGVLRSLSATWSTLQNKDVAVKRCIRNYVCSDRSNDCDEGAMKRATELKQAVDAPGCAYWLRSFCAVGNQAW